MQWGSKAEVRWWWWTFYSRGFWGTSASRSGRRHSIGQLIFCRIYKKFTHSNRSSGVKNEENWTTEFTILSPYLIGCSRLASTLAPGLRQFSHLIPWWGWGQKNMLIPEMSRCVLNIIAEIVPAVVQSRCRCIWHPGTPSATGCPPDKLFHHHSTLIHLGFR